MRFAIKSSVLAVVYLCVFSLIAACSEQNSNSSLTRSTDYDPASLQNSINSRVVTSQDAFSQTLYPLLTQNCASCHSTQGAVPPLIADPDPAIAFNEIKNTTKINLALPANARVVLKLKLESHNCWSVSCSADGRALQNAIVDLGFNGNHPSG